MNAPINIYSKVVSTVSKGWVTYSQISKSVSFNFNVRFNNNGDVDCLNEMSKRVNNRNDWTVRTDVRDGDITEEEFSEALNKTLEFIKRNNYNSNKEI